MGTETTETEATPCGNGGGLAQVGPITFARFGGAKVPDGQVITEDWDQLADRLTHHEERSTKDGPAFSLVTYRGGQVRRKNANVETVNGLILDIDDGTPLDALRERLDPFAWVAYTTYSHTAVKPKYRIVIPFSNPVLAADWSKVWREGVAFFTGNRADASCKDLARLYYGPSCPPGADRWAERHEGRPLDPAELPPVEEAAEVRPRAVQARPAAGRRINLRGVRVWDWFEAHENYGRLVDEERGVHAVRCPWEDGHSSGRGAEDTDTVVFDGRDGRPPAFDCKHSSCVDRRLRDVQDLWADAREFGATVDYPLNDDGNGQRLVDAHGEDFRYSKALGLLLWDGRRWNRGRDGEVEAAVRELARQVIRSIYDELSAIPDGTRQQVFSHARKSGNQERIVAMVKSATDSRSIQVTADQFDQDPWALNFLNGTVDLRTGERRDHRREDYLTRCLPHPYEPSATCPRFDQFMSEVFAGDQEVVEFVWRAIGYTLTGSVREQVLFFLYGSGSNGKSTLLEVLQRLLENYGGTAAPGLLMESKGDRHPTEVADLKGKRLVACVETGEGKQLAEELIKRLTGGDKMKGRFMRQDFFEFDPTHKLWLSSNHKPVIKGTDYAIWRRIPLIPFEVTFKDAKQAQPGEPVKDPNLLEVLLSEATGILAKAVRYAQDWYQNGLQTPQKVRAATEEYRSEMDIFGQFLEECCSLEDPQGEAQRDDIIQEFNRWCQRTGVRGNYGKNFVARSLGEKGVNYRKSGSRYFYQGIRLLSLAEQSVNRRELAEGIR